MLALITLVLDASPPTPPELRWQLAGVAIGFILLSVGLAAIAVFLFRGSSDLTLVYFGSASILYALRVLFGERMIRLVFPIENSVWNHLILLIDCFIAVPFTLFLTQIVELRWKNTIRWLVAVQLAFGFVRLAFTLLKIGEKAVKVGNNVFIIFFCVLIAVYYVFSRPDWGKSREISVVFASLLVFVMFAVEGNLADLKLLPAHRPIERIGFLIFELRRWSGGDAERTRDDDITLLILDFQTTP